MVCRYKFLALGVIFILSDLVAMAQSPSATFPKKTLLALRNAKPDTNRIGLLLELASYYLDKNNQAKNDLDSCRLLIAQADQLSSRLGDVEWQYKVLAISGQYFVKAGFFERGRQYLMRAVNHYHQTGNLSKEADSWQSLGELYADNGHLGYETDRIDCFERARSLYLRNHMPVSAAAVLIKISNVHIDEDQLDLAEKELHQVLSEYNDSGYKGLEEAYHTLSLVAQTRGNYYRSLAYASEGIKSMRANGDTIWAARLYHAMGKSNFSAKKYADALEWIRKAVSAEKGEYAFAYRCVLVQTLLELNRTEEARPALAILSTEEPRLNLYEILNLYRITALYYNKINNSKLAVDYNLRILNHARLKEVSDDYYNIWSVLCDNEIAGIFLKDNQAPKAGKYLNHAALIFKNAKGSLEPRYLATFYGHNYKYNLAIGNYQAAVINLENRDRIQDSLLTADKDKQVSELNIQYQTAQKEQSIKDLHNKGALQQARLETANLQRNITIAGILLMIGVSTFIYMTYRQKQQANRMISHKNQLLQHLLTEKEWLLKEVHHRVKNNLHTVISLLESQARYLENDALKAIETSQHRIFAMSLIHQQLYHSDDIKTIEMESYIAELLNSLQESFDTAARIQFRQAVEPINLTISYAIPLGLIINEAVTNSIKYAFPNNNDGEISLSMTVDGGQITLVVADNGIGMPEIKDDTEQDSLGLRLLRGLGEDIDAEVDFRSDNGTIITIVFKPDVINDVESFSNPLHEST